MAGYHFLIAVLFYFIFCFSGASESDKEPICSQFQYDRQILESIVRMEAKMNMWNKEREIFEEYILSVMENRKEKTKQEFIKQNEKLQGLTDDFEKLSDKTFELEKKTSNFSSTPKIAFNAYTMASRNYKVGQTVMFPEVLLNEGGGFDETIGIFTAPVAGLYYFSVHLCHSPATYMVAALFHEDVKFAITSEYESNGGSCSSVMAPLKMSKGERVNVKATYDSSMLADSEYRWPSFTGALLNI